MSSPVEITWKTIRRETGLIEHVCQHGVGHPNAGSIQYMDWYWNEYEKFQFDFDKEGDNLLYQMPILGPVRDSTWEIHGCDGCCGREDFPGTASNAIAYAINMLDDDELQELRNKYFVLWWGLMAAVNEAVAE